MRIFLKLIAGLLGLIIAVAVGVVIWLQDANRLKPEIETLIAENSDYDVKIRGDLSWQLFPPLRLHLGDLSIQDTSGQKTDESANTAQRIEAEALDLEMDLSAMWQDVNRWRVKGFTLTNTTITEDDSTTRIESLTLEDFALGEPARLAAKIGLEDSEAADEPPLKFDVQGFVTYHPGNTDSGERIVVRDLAIESEITRGTCQADIVENANAAATVAVATPDDNDEEDPILPLETLAVFDMAGDCALTELNLGGETFQDVELQFTNVAGKLNAMMNIDSFMDGTVMAEVDIDTTGPTPEWTILPEVSNVDSQRLLNWTDQRLQWVAPIALNSTIKMQGNTEQELAASIQAQSEFDGGQGQLNIAKLKEQLLRIAVLTRSGEKIQNWPDLWNYEHFTGRLNIDGAQHALSFALDNMSVKADGQVDYLANTMDMLAYVTIHEAPEASPFDINPLLQDTRIPVRCRGPSDDPKCKVDEGAARNLVAKALQGGEDSGLRRKLDEKIEENVPEEYRDTARSILDILGRSLERD